VTSNTASADPYARYAQNAGYAVPVYKGPAVPAAPAPATSVTSNPVTADGVPLAGWWWRVLAAVLDSLLLGVVAAAYSPLIPNLYSGVTNWFQDAMNAASSGATTMPSLTDPAYHLQTALLTLSLAELVVSCVYVALMLGLFGATLGQMACGLRVVPVDHGTAPRRLPATPVALRIVFYTMLPTLFSLASDTNLSIAALLSTVGFLYSVINALWAAWDPKRQCIHDKIAHTQVVRPAG